MLPISYAHPQFLPPLFSRPSGCILLEYGHVEESVKDRLRAKFGSLDPVALKEIREAQADPAEPAACDPQPADEADDLAPFLASLTRAWEDGEVRSTHRQPAKPARTW